MLELHYARRATRRLVDMPCQLVERSWDEPVNHRVTDISSQGVWIRTSFPLPVGERVVLSFLPPGDDAEEITVFAEVARVVERGPRAERGMGLSFVDLGKDQRCQLAAALRTLAMRPERSFPITRLLRRGLLDATPAEP